MSQAKSAERVVRDIQRKTRRRVSQGSVLRQQLRVVRQFARYAGMVAKHLYRRRHGVIDRQMINQRADEFGTGGPVAYTFGEVLVHRLGRLSTHPRGVEASERPDHTENHSHRTEQRVPARH